MLPIPLENEVLPIPLESVPQIPLEELWVEALESMPQIPSRKLWVEPVALRFLSSLGVLRVTKQKNNLNAVVVSFSTNVGTSKKNEHMDMI